MKNILLSPHIWSDDVELRLIYRKAKAKAKRKLWKKQLKELCTQIMEERFEAIL